MNKRVLLVFLVGVNVLLLAVLLLNAYQPASAYAQATGARRGDYVLFSAQAEVGNEAVYLLDGATRQLHVFRSNYPHAAGTPFQIRYLGPRNLANDFGAAAGPGGRR